MEFKNTDEALIYGQSIKNDPQLIHLLREQREKLVKEVHLLMEKDKTTEALYLASGQAQFTREALEEALK